MKKKTKVKNPWLISVDEWKLPDAPSKHESLEVEKQDEGTAKAPAGGMEIDSASIVEKMSMLKDAMKASSGKVTWTMPTSSFGESPLYEKLYHQVQPSSIKYGAGCSAMPSFYVYKEGEAPEGKVGLALRKTEWGISLLAVNEDGSEMDCGHILTFEQDGSICRSAGVGDSIGIKKCSTTGKIAIK